MSSVQPENGYTKIAHEIFEVLATTNLNGTQRRILDVLFRQTYGYNRKEHSLSIKFISKATNIHKKQIQRELNWLIDKKIIIVTSEATFNKSRKLSFNKNYNMWELNRGEVANKLPPNEKEPHTGSGLATRTGSELAPQIKKKENIKEKDFKSVFDYYLTLDLIKHKKYKPEMAKAMKKAMNELNCDTEHLKILLKRHEEKVKATENNEFPIKVRGITEFFGQKAYNATHLICSEYDDDVYKPPKEDQTDNPYGHLTVYK
jgi:phage replication O-like protein O